MKRFGFAVFVLILMLCAVSCATTNTGTNESDEAPAVYAQPEDTPPASAFPVEVAKTEPPDDNISLTLVATGDINLNRNLVEVLPNGSDVWGTIVPFPEFFAQIKDEINGDINLGNIETVITDRNDIPAQTKAFCFRTHPNGVREILKTGFNLFSMANNHSYDYGAEGVTESLKHLAILEKEYDFHWTGIGKDKDQAIEPAIFTVKGVKVGLTSLGIGHAAGTNTPGVAQEYYYKEALARLRDADVDLRILSCHDGKEGTQTPIDRQLRVYRSAVSDYGVDVVIGHHPHVVQGVERYKDGVIFYSLGNFMIRGAADMGKRPASHGIRDFGLLSRIHMKIKKGQGPKFEKIEILPVYDMHQGVHKFADPAEAHVRVDTVNHLSTLSAIGANQYAGLPTPSAVQGMIFEKANGIGVYKFPNE